MLSMRKGPNRLAVAGSAITGQLVVDKTGIAGPLDFRLVYLPEDNIAAVDDAGDAPLPDDRPAPSIFTVLQEQLGLKLEPARGPREYLVIDHIERPSAN